MPLLVFLIACGRSGTSQNVVHKREDGGTPGDAAIALAPLQLGMPDVASFAYRARGGHPAFKLAREAEAEGTWQEVAAHCRDALTADPQHLDAAYLYAVALAKTGAGAEQIVLPLSTAVAGDFAKWAQASLEQPALQPFLATPIGQAWKLRITDDGKTFVTAVARSLLVTSEHDLFAYDGEGKRWYRLTRTGGAIVAAMIVRSQHKLVFVTRERVKETGKPRTKVGVGLVDLASGRSRKSVPLPDDVPASAAIALGYVTKGNLGFFVRAGKTMWRLAENGKLALEPQPAGKQLDTPAFLADMTRLVVTGHSARVDRPAVDHVTADWDDNMLASAIKIGRSKKVVTVPSPGLIVGDSATWSADATQLGFVAQLSETCKPGAPTAAAFVADAATGAVRELERAVGGIALEWAGERTLAIAGDHGVSLVSLDGSAPTALTGADGLVAPRRKPKCSPEPVVDEPIVDDEEATAEPSDAGVRAH